MLYEYQYDIASVISVLFLLAIFLIRRSFATKSNRILFWLLISDLLGALFDLLSVVCISFPQRYPMWVNYLTANGYLFFYNLMGVMFFAYIDSKAKNSSMQKFAKITVTSTIIFYALIIFTSPWTHLVNYFAEDGSYHHGPAMVILYVLAAIMLFLAAYSFYLGRRKFNGYQIFAMGAFVIAAFGGVFIQAIAPKILVGQFGCTLVLFFIYFALENPDYYIYKDTNCLNRDAFLLTLKNIRTRNVNMVGLCLKDYGDIRHTLSQSNLERLTKNISTAMWKISPRRAFCIDEDKYIFIVENDDDIEKIISNITREFDKPWQVIDTDIVIQPVFVRFKKILIMNEEDLVESSITSILNSKERVESVTNTDFVAVAEKIKENYEISKGLRKAIEEKNFQVYFQPIYHTETGEFSSAEALVRYVSDSGKFISPEIFIPMAEREGLIFDIGEIVFEKVCRFMKKQGELDLGIDYMEINLSPLQCFKSNLVSVFTSTMDKYDIDPSCINLEITETAEFSENNLMRDNINEFHAMGISFSLDDYGSGFAAQDYLFKLPVSIVKIDKSILWNAMNDENAMTVLRSTVEMLKKLGKRIVVEGVETKEMVDILVEMKCDYLQGYYFSKPIDEEKYIEFMRNQGES